MTTDATSPETQPSENKARFWAFDRTRAARIVAIVGVIAVAVAGKWLVWPSAPQDRFVDFEVGSPSEIVGLDVRWSGVDTNEELRTTSMTFSAGSAPAVMRTQVRLPAGTYNLAVTIERTDRVDSTRRRITLGDGDRITIPLR